MSRLIDMGIGYLKEGKELDNAEKYQEALEKYKSGVQAILSGCKYEKNAQRASILKNHATQYLTRAEQIKDMLKKGPKAIPAGAPAPKGGSKGGKKDDNPDSPDSGLSGALASAIITEKPNVKWDDVAGLEAAKAALQEAVILPAKFPQLFTGKRQPWRGILLYGPPGTGKSYVAKAVATECDATFFSISSSDLVSKYQGESERLVKTLFSMAREQAPSIVFIDEIDSLASARTDSDSDSTRRIKTELLVQMQGVGKDSEGVLVLGATNFPQNLDSAVRRRFEKRIYIGLPEAHARRTILELNLGSTPNSLTSTDFDKLARGTEGFSGSDIAILMKGALMEPIRELQEASFFRQDEEGLYYACASSHPGAIELTLAGIQGTELGTPKVNVDHCSTALSHMHPSVGQSDIDALVEWANMFGSE